MKISDKLAVEINEQIGHEFYSAYLYLSMAAWCDSANLEGSGHYFRLQAKEEAEHAMKFFNHALERGANIVFKSIPEPKENFSSLVDVFTKTLAHEEFITRRINTLMEIAQRENDYLAISFLTWFVNEQHEEEKSAERTLNRLKMIGSSGSGLIMLDHQLGKRE
ncbi:MAG: ferritin [Candidatus Hydrogenedentes bacterium CG07_land_8_20_14_0_80_42_17]|nr:MAG: ferritin [Candidatus Hydrogenedentes bacterium CG07_land_8_20_14_0_80_42_17]